jgi:hypothetical protein
VPFPRALRRPAASTGRSTRSGDLPTIESVVVLALAASRLARAVSVDDITAPARRRVGEWAQRRDSEGARWLVELLHCPVCTGWWASLAVSLAAPGQRRLLRGVSVAGAQVVLTLAERLISEEGRAAISSADLLESTAAPIAA